MSFRASIVAPLVAAFVATGVSVRAQSVPAEGRQPRPGQTAPPERDRVMPQGFSVVLVVADLQASSAQDDVPPAARRALGDMKDFLPYKSYRLVDAAWILGQSTSGTSTRLRGPEEQEYELKLYSSRSEASRVSVRFTLSDAGTPEASMRASREKEREIEALRSQIQEVQRQLEEVRRERQGMSADEAKVRDKKIEELKNKQTEMQAAVREYETARRGAATTREPYGPRKSSGRTIIDTSFTMDVGETVVVGTSRLKANSKALIALLTAVPPKGPKPPTEVR